MCYVVIAIKFCYDIKKFVMTSISATYYKKLVIMSQTRQKHVKNTSKTRRDVKRFVMKSKTCHDIDKCDMTSKHVMTSTNVSKKFVMMSKTYDDVKKFINNMA